jgi:hypothetical protein
MIENLRSKFQAFIILFGMCLSIYKYFVIYRDFLQKKQDTLEYKRLIFLYDRTSQLKYDQSCSFY